MAPTFLLIAFLGGCGPDPVEQDAVAYHAAVTPLFSQNLVIATGFLDIASRVKKGEAPPEQVAQRLSTELSPAADQLKAAVEKIEPVTPALGEAHTVLVRAWTDRAAAYHAMNDAWNANDPVAFEAAQKQNLQSKLDEERYFSTANAALAPYGLVLDQYP